MFVETAPILTAKWAIKTNIVKDVLIHIYTS